MVARAADKAAARQRTSARITCSGRRANAPSLSEDDLPDRSTLTAYASWPAAPQSGAARAMIVRTCGIYGHAPHEGNFVETMLLHGGRWPEGRWSTTSGCRRRRPPTAPRKSSVLRVDTRHCARGRRALRLVRGSPARYSLSGRAVDLRPISSADYAALGRRPEFSAAQAAGMRHWMTPAEAGGKCWRTIWPHVRSAASQRNCRRGVLPHIRRGAAGPGLNGDLFNKRTVVINSASGVTTKA